MFWIVADIAAGVNAVIFYDLPANGSKDILKFILVGWAISRSQFNPRQTIVLCMTAIVFSVLPIAIIYTDCSGGSCIQLNSVGHVNHTAIYLLIVYMLSSSLLLLNFQNISRATRLTLLISIIVLAYTIVDAWSRATYGILVVYTLMLLVYAMYYFKSRLTTIWLSIFIALSTLTTVYNPPPVFHKLVNGSNVVGGDSIRQKIRNHSYYVSQSSPVLGVGFGNYVHFGHDNIKELVVSKEGRYDSSQFLPSDHPHNIYYTYLVGGGLVVFTIFVWFWLHIFRIIYKLNRQSDEKWLILSAIGVAMTTLLIGWVNTTLAHEHALISMFILGMLISKYRELEKG